MLTEVQNRVEAKTNENVEMTKGGSSSNLSHHILGRDDLLKSLDRFIDKV